MARQGNFLQGTCKNHGNGSFFLIRKLTLAILGLTCCREVILQLGALLCSTRHGPGMKCKPKPGQDAQLYWISPGRRKVCIFNWPSGYIAAVNRKKTETISHAGQVFLDSVKIPNFIISAGARHSPWEQPPSMKHMVFISPLYWLLRWPQLTLPPAKAMMLNSNLSGRAKVLGWAPGRTGAIVVAAVSYRLHRHYIGQVATWQGSLVLHVWCNQVLSLQQSKGFLAYRNSIKEVKGSLLQRFAQTATSISAHN